MKPVKIFSLLMSILTVLGGCSAHDYNTDLLSIPVKGTVSITGEELVIYQQKIQQHTNTGALRNTIPKLFEQDYLGAETTVYSIQKNKETDHLGYAIIFVFDGVPDDDSVSGYRYDLYVQSGEDSVFQLIKLEESWRCWQGRGRRYFSADPCK